MLRQRRHRARTHITANADFERNIVIPKMRQQLRIVDRADAVADSFRSNLDRIPDALRAGCLSGVTRKPQSTIASLSVQIAKPESGSLSFKASYADPDHSVAHSFRGEIEDGLGGFGSELADSVHNPANRNGTPVVDSTKPLPVPNPQHPPS